MKTGSHITFSEPPEFINSLRRSKLIDKYFVDFQSVIRYRFQRTVDGIARHDLVSFYAKEKLQDIGPALMR